MRRNRLEIIGQILEYCKNPRPKTRILQYVNLSFSLNEKYLNLLISEDLLVCRKEKTKKLHQTTSKGRKYIGLFQNYKLIKEKLLNEITSKTLAEDKLEALLSAVKAN